MASNPLLEDLNSPQFEADEEVLKLHASRLWLPLAEVIVEIKMLYSIALPLIITGLLTYGKSFVSMLFLGNLGEDALAGGSLAIGIANITGYSVIAGLALGMDAISSQAFGANQHPLMAQTLHRTVLILLLGCIPISLLWIFIDPILTSLKQDKDISSTAACYLLFSLPDLLFQSFINPIRIYLRSQKITAPLMVSASLGLACHAPINYLLTGYLKLKVPGVAVAAALTDLIILAAMLVYLYPCGLLPNPSLAGAFDFNSVREWKSIIKLAFPSCASVCLEWWWYELMILLSGLLQNAREAVATMGIIIQATSLVYIFPSSLSNAASTRVGNELGAGKPEQARRSSIIALLCAAVTSVIAMAFMLAFSSTWGWMYTKEEAIAMLTAAVMPVVGVCELGNCPQTTGCGVLRGTARPGLGVRINFGAFYGVGLPLAVFMCFGMKMGLLGLMFGLLGAQAACCFLMVRAVFKTDWTVQVQRANELIGGHNNDYNNNGGNNNVNNGQTNGEIEEEGVAGEELQGEAARAEAGEVLQREAVRAESGEEVIEVEA